MTKEEKAKDKRLQKLYGISLENYNQRFAEQGGVCKTCGRPPVTISLSVDHDRKWKYLKIECSDSVMGWTASVALNQKIPCAARYHLGRGWGFNKNDARNALKAQLKPLSVRGLLCASCNIGLRKFADSPERLENAAKYLRHHQESEL